MDEDIGRGEGRQSGVWHLKLYVTGGVSRFFFFCHVFLGGFSRSNVGRCQVKDV